MNLLRYADVLDVRTRTFSRAVSVARLIGFSVMRVYEASTRECSEKEGREVALYLLLVENGGEKVLRDLFKRTLPAAVGEFATVLNSKEYSITKPETESLPSIIEIVKCLLIGHVDDATLCQAFGCPETYLRRGSATDWLEILMVSQGSILAIAPSNSTQEEIEEDIYGEHGENLDSLANLTELNLDPACYQDTFAFAFDPMSFHTVRVRTTQKHANLGFDTSFMIGQSSPASCKGDSPGRASIALCPAEIPAILNDQVSGPGQSYRPNTSSISPQSQFDGEQQCAGSTGKIIPNFVQSIPNQASEGVNTMDVVEVTFTPEHFEDTNETFPLMGTTALVSKIGGMTESEFGCHSKSTALRIANEFRMSRSPSPPRDLLVSESLFRNIKTYFELCNLDVDAKGSLLSTDGANNLCAFDSYCFTATLQSTNGSILDFRYLGKACALVRQILQIKHPRTLACFLKVFIHLTQSGYPHATRILCDFIKRMSTRVTQKEDPWSTICLLLGQVDSESFYQTMVKAWECTTDSLDSRLGKSSRLAVSVRLDYIKRVHGVANLFNEERLLQDILAETTGTLSQSTPRVMLNLAQNWLKQKRYDDAERLAREIVSLLGRTYAGRTVERIECFKIIAHTQFHQGKTQAAEHNIQSAIQLIEDQLGRQHCWVIEFKTVLEDWLRSWDRQDAADILRKEIQELMAVDESAAQI